MKKAVLRSYLKIDCVAGGASANEIIRYFRVVEGIQILSALRRLKRVTPTLLGATSPASFTALLHEAWLHLALRAKQLAMKRTPCLAAPAKVAHARHHIPDFVTAHTVHTIVACLSLSDLLRLLSLGKLVILEWKIVPALGPVILVRGIFKLDPHRFSLVRIRLT